MKPALRLLCLAACTLFLFCGDPTLVKYCSTLSVPPQGGRTDCVIVLSGEPHVNYQGNVENEFGAGDANELIRAFFRKQLPADIEETSIMRPVSLGTPDQDYSSQRLVLDIDKVGDVTYLVPLDGTVLSFDGKAPAFVLFVGEVTIESEWEGHSTPGYFVPGPYGAGHFTGGGFSSSKNLVIGGKFAFWDNTVGKLISYGYVQSVDENTFAVSMEDWISAMDIFVKKMLDGLGLEKRGSF